MKVVFGGSSGCTLTTAKRLFLLADEVIFTDMPSVMYGDWGSVGQASDARMNIDYMSDKPVTLSVVDPLEISSPDVYAKYWDADLSNLQFRREVMRGLASDPTFAEKFIHPENDYKFQNGVQLVASLLADKSLLEVPLNSQKLEAGPYDDTDAGRRVRFMFLLNGVSTALTNAMVVSQQGVYAPVADDKIFSRLMTLRLTDEQYVGPEQNLASFLGFEVMRTVIPEIVLERMSVADILNYREATTDQYKVFSEEEERLSNSLLGVEPEKLSNETIKLIGNEVKPKIREFRRETKDAYEKMFGEFYKKIIPSAGIGVTAFAGLSVSHLSNISMSGAISLFATAANVLVPPAIDYVQSVRQTKRKNSMTYLVGMVGVDEDTSPAPP